MSEQIMKKLGEHEQIFNEHKQILNEHTQILKEHKQISLGIENRLSSVESDVAFLKEDAHKKGILFEEHTSKLNQILEVVLHTNEMLVPRQEIDFKFENHENRIAALEYSRRNTPEITPNP